MCYLNFALIPHKTHISYDLSQKLSIIIPNCDVFRFPQLSPEIHVVIKHEKSQNFTLYNSLNVLLEKPSQVFSLKSIQENKTKNPFLKIGTFQCIIKTHERKFQNCLFRRWYIKT